MNSSKLEAAQAQAHLIACSERYAAAFPAEDGYRRRETLNEDVLGGDLWNAARVSFPAPSTCQTFQRLEVFFFFMFLL